MLRGLNLAEAAVVGAGPAIVLVHGTLGSWRQVSGFAADLSPDRTVVPVSRPGYGMTPLGTGRTYEQQADAYLALLDRLAITRSSILGISGGAIRGRIGVPTLALHGASDQFVPLAQGRSTGVTFLDLDITSDQSVRAVVRLVIERFGRLDVLVNNAGTGAAGAAEESSITQDQRVFDINFFGLVRMTKAVLPHMRAAGKGRIINISSVLGLVPAPYMASYAATKHAIEGSSQSVDHEVREHGVRVLLVEPAYTRTGFDANAIQPDAPLPIYAEQRHVLDGVIARAMADGDDPAIVAKAIVTAATDPKPKLRYTAGSTAGRVSALRRFVPTRSSTARSGSSIACPPEPSTFRRAST